MKKNKRKTNSKTLKSLEKYTEQLNVQYKQKRRTTEQLDDILQSRQRRFNIFRRSRLLQLAQKQVIKDKLRNGAAYLLGRRNLKRLYSPTYKRKQASNDLIPYMRSLYEEGFIEKTLSDLQRIFSETNNKYMKRAVAFELGFYFSNQFTKEAAHLALYYLTYAERGEKNIELKRQLTLLKAENKRFVGELTAAKQTIHSHLQKEQHPDLYLALANVEKTLTGKLYWLNETYKKYNRTQINLSQTIDRPTYYALHYIEKTTKRIKGPKISVIIPAYNAEKSLPIAIESMLNQTWENIEILIVDDCSTDRTLKVAENYAAKDDRIQVTSTAKNSGPYVARNIGLQIATGDFVTINDADDWSHPEKLAVQAEHLLTNPSMIANTSEQVRLTEDFLFHRRGTRGRYIFSNMSSLMFRRREVIDTIGYWDEVRFAADGEFKRRLQQAFGKDYVIDLQTGPLSLPEQSLTSLTASKAFGYSGHFIGARKEYVASFSYYYKQTNNYYYSIAPEKRYFPVPEPMLPDSTRKTRYIPVIIVADFSKLTKQQLHLITKEIEKNKQLGIKTGLVQKYTYNPTIRHRNFPEEIRHLIDGHDVQKIVYGESIEAEVTIVHTVTSLQEKQQYVPNIKQRIVVLIIDETPKITYNNKRITNYDLRHIIRQTMILFDQTPRIYPLNEKIRSNIKKKHKHKLGTIRLVKENWLIESEHHEERYGLRLKDWLVVKK